MNSRSFLGVTLGFFLVLVVESLSLKPPLRAPLRPSAGSRQVLARHSNLFLVRGGDTEEEMTEVPITSGNINNRIMSVLDPSAVTGALVALGTFYSNSLESAPVLTKSVTAAVLFGISDQLAQGLEIQRNRAKTGETSSKPLVAITNKKRSVFSALVGLLYFGPMAHLWYGWIFKTFPGKSMLSILQKAALGQFFFAPPLFCVFFAAALLQNGQFTLTNWISKIRQDLIKGWLGGLGFWPFINYISYGYVPPKYIPLFINVMGLIFNIYVSLIANLKQDKPKTS
ncbi:PXMP2/4 family protein [Seminavis robusta]|uniref:PXMP2/4 family protein n=1 Tax=Seminavis robusta TaxID=568900 RepID=A0A9N8E1P8_9STRA|nr:PXMP2/4 family protein [Seminavis robusta]|eukprot:Sro443_g144090.1 PXMP2/4 family protein (284) ;mRNA; f:38934-40120